MKKIIPYFVALIFLSCSNNAIEKGVTPVNSTKISEKEDKGIKEILEYYGGECKYAIGTTASINSNKTAYFEIELKGSRFFEQEKYLNIIDMPASNIAYLFYKNLNDETKKYDEIHVLITLNNGDIKTFKFSASTLEMVLNKMTLANTLINHLKERKFTEIKPLVDNTNRFGQNLNIDELLLKTEKAEEDLGEIKNFIPFGFGIQKLSNPVSDILHISGLIIRDKKKTEFSVDIAIVPNEPQSKIVSWRYKF